MLQKIVVIAALLLCGTAAAQERAPVTGQWTLDAPAPRDDVHLTIQRRSRDSRMSSSSRVPIGELRGLTTAQLASSDGHVAFELIRDAGTLAFDGHVSNGGGGGTFTFTARPDFASEMAALGYDDLSSDTVFQMAVHDVSTAYARELQALDIRPESADDLIAMRIHGVTPEFARAVRDLGYSVDHSDLVTMRIHGASADFVKQIRALGYEHATVEELVSLRIHGVTPEHIERLRERGMRNLSLEQAVSLRIHGILD